MNAKSTMYKLQTALCAKGIRVRINQRQHYSEKAGRMVTQYIAQEEGISEAIIKTYRPHEIVKALADRLNGGDVH